MNKNSHIHVADGSSEERAKYREIWTDVPEYRNYSPGLENVERLMSVLRPSVGSTLIDVGCGGGVAGLAFKTHGLDVWYADITDAGLVPEVDRSRFIMAPLWAPGWNMGQRWDIAFCCDVMEHIPPEYTMLVLDRIIASAEVSWFQISLVPDAFGAKIGQPLHLTVQPFKWWLTRLATLGTVVDARDLCGEAMFMVRR